MALDYWYDGQFRRYFLQFVHIFQGFQYVQGRTADGKPIFRTVPAKMAVKDRQVGHILRNNSENTMMTVPQITCDVVSMTLARDRIQQPNFVSTVQVYEREINPVNQQYLETLGKTYTVQRYMAVPYDLTMQMDLWTSNESQKHQLLEQIMILFNPSIDLQTGTNAIDWTSLTIVEMQDTNWSSRGLTIGTDDAIEISTLTFKMPIWLSPPAKVKRQTLIQQIITNIGEMETYQGIDTEGALGYWGTSDLLGRIITTPGNHQIEVSGQEITLLGAGGAEHEGGNVFEWKPLLEKYGKLRPGVSQIRLKTTEDMDDHDTDIVGTLDWHHSDANRLVWTMDISSLPRNTLKDIDAIIDPHRSWPGTNLNPVSQGQRYLITQDIQPGSVAWGNLDAGAGDIVQYSNGEWVVSFDASAEQGIQYVLNSYRATQLKWFQGQWQASVEGDYNTGYWRLIL
jgi:hypothetical protein